MNSLLMSPVSGPKLGTLHSVTNECTHCFKTVRKTVALVVVKLLMYLILICSELLQPHSFTYAVLFFVCSLSRLLAVLFWFFLKEIVGENYLKIKAADNTVNF